MAAKKKPVTQQMRESADALKGPHVSDEWTGLFDAYVSVQDGDLPPERKEKLLTIIQNGIEQLFGKNSKNYKSEAEYIFHSAQAMAKKWILGGVPMEIPFGPTKGKTITVSNMLSADDIDDVASMTVEKIISSSRDYEAHSYEAQKYTYIKTAASSIVMDLLRKAKKQSDIIKLAHLKAGPKKRIA
ncbi:MAG: hypothetical protein JST80_11460 [Bdellovibrionales bacterium]|nr:hypothetical protein [Bdellovibrionales bacterium]